jgi:arsenate reductase
MAEAIVNWKLSDKWKAFSAGTKPAGYVHPLAIKVLEEIGIHHLGYSKDASQYFGQKFDLVITVCDSAAEDCPIWLSPGKQIHIPFIDPAKIEGDEQTRFTAFRMIREQIDEKIISYLNNSTF